MARFIPSEKPKDFHNSLGEKEAYEALQKLNDKYTIFYSLRWVGQSGRRTEGEADFVIFHPNKGVMVLEIKSGGIAHKDGQWIQTNTRTKEQKVIEPFEQAQKSKYELKERLNQRKLGFHTPLMCHAVWFTSIEVSNSFALPLDCSREIILDRGSLSRTEKDIDKAFAFWANQYFTQSPLNSSQEKKVIDILCPCFHIVPKLETTIKETEQFYIQLTRQQANVLDFLEEQDTAVIHGLAGTGKTVLAVEKAKRLSEQGENVLFLCYNRFLRDSLKQTNPIPNVKFHTAHTLAYEIMGDSNTELDEVLKEFEEYLEIVFDAESWKYKNIIVDEGQDLDDRLLNRLYEFVRRKKGCFYVFYDRNQLINLDKQQPRWIEDAECRLVLHKNCRNTAEIFKTSCHMLGVQQSGNNEIHGELPEGLFYHTKNELEEIVNSYIKQMLAGGLHTEDIVILTAKDMNRTCLSIDKEYGGCQLSTEQSGNKVLFTTIRKFKGLEAKAVLIIDSSMRDLLNDKNKMLMYVGASRAQDILEIAMIEDVEHAEYGEFLKEFAPDRNMPKNKKGFKRLLGLK